MKKNDVFTFTAPNGAEVTAVVISVVDATLPCKIDRCWTERRMLYICYGQNRLFTMTTKIEGTLFCKEVGNPEYGEILVDYAILPDYDELLQLHSSMEYPLWEQNLETEIQGMNDR